MLVLAVAAPLFADSFMEDVDRVIRMARLEAGGACGSVADDFVGVHLAAMGASAGASVYYPNGKVLTNYARQAGATLYYPNGQVATNYAMQAGATWYYPNGQVATNYMGQPGGTWYYPNGRVLTNYAGQVGATWYHANGRVLCNYMGQAGATWYYENGNTMISSGPAFSAGQLLDVPAILAQIYWSGQP
jgi:hypothetical protein